MKCPYCGSNRVKENDNFCGECGRKLKTVCNCWIKKGGYNCGEDSCPGRELFIKELRALKTSEQARSQNQYTQLRQQPVRIL